MKLLREEELVWSDVVANTRMNRKRKASGVNSYQKELKFSPELFLNTMLEKQQQVKWLDLCCGEGGALEYDERRKIINCKGFRKLAMDVAYLGANDKAGPNYTGQEAVDSYYKCVTHKGKLIGCH